MTEANEFLNNLEDGYNKLKQHEMISLPKIRLQSIMHEYATSQLLARKNILSHIVVYLQNQIKWRTESLRHMNQSHEIPKRIQKEIEELRSFIDLINKK